MENCWKFHFYSQKMDRKVLYQNNISVSKFFATFEACFVLFRNESKKIFYKKCDA